MKSVTRTAALLLLFAFGTEATGIASVGSKDAAYLGGTSLAIAGVTDPVDGSIDTTDDAILAFHALDTRFATHAIDIPYASVTGIEYGQKVGRRVGAAIGYTCVFGPAGLLALLSKKRRHYVTITYRAADGTSQAALFEVGKNAIRPTLAVLEARTGRKVVYQGKEASQQGSW